MILIGRFLTFLVSAGLGSLLSLLMTGLLGLVLLYLYYSPRLPDKAALHQIELQVPMRIYDQNQQLLAEYGDELRRPLSFNAIPPQLINAFIAIEDSRFYEHRGIDLTGVARAMKGVLSTGNASQGASTITMQLARNAFLNSQKTFDRKLKETLLALKIEENLSKQEILEIYLNKIYLGNRAYGIGAAAETYYGKSVQELNLAEMAMIAGLPKAPSAYNPIVNPKRAMERRDYILLRMLQQNYITEAAYQEAIALPNTASVHRTEMNADASYFVEMVRLAVIERFGQQDAYNQGYHVYTTLDSKAQHEATQALRTELLAYDKRHGYRGAEVKLNLSDFKSHDALLSELSSYPTLGDLQPAIVLESNHQQARLLLSTDDEVTLTLPQVEWARPYISVDRRGSKPKYVSDVLKAGDLVRLSTEADGSFKLSQVPKVSGATLLLDAKDGAMRAMVGGFDYNQSKFNRAIQARRQPGSSFKPFLYATAFTQGYTPNSIVNDAPITIQTSSGNWTPQNYGRRYIGPTTLREALAKSRNLVSVRLLKTIGIQPLLDYAMRFGFAPQDLPNNYTLALGTVMTTPLQMATAYATFANGGFKVDPYFITRITNSNGEVLLNARPDRACGDNVEYCTITNTGQTNPLLVASVQPAAKRIMDERTHYFTMQVLQEVVQKGTASRASKVLKRKALGGKTGTTNDQKDAWFCGVTPDYSAVSWIGFDNMKELGDGETGTNAALPVWIQLMAGVLGDSPDIVWAEPENMKLAQPIPSNRDTADDVPANAADKMVINAGQSNSRPSPTPRFEYKNTRHLTEAAPTSAPAVYTPRASVDNGRPRPAPTRPSRPVQPRSEAVEIPEQIF
ncbi:penicillin-binding protein 1A [Thiofilum flexile]|uniref:penicillin-binding protein 1A n=1 Tax=Thiofilum flexile TaxID=125627 RepID=UPI00037DF1BE|nr:penicillin-binding protein 1A [Thiofilum flexile]